MENLLFCLNVTVPIFLMMVIGMVLKSLKVLDSTFTTAVNKFVFALALPASLFRDMATSHFSQVWDTRFVLFCFFATLGEIAIAAGLSLFLKSRSLRGEFVQAAYRSSASLLGVALIRNMYGNSGFGPLMIIGSVPLYNIMAVVVLSFTQPGNSGIDRKTRMKNLKAVATSRLIVGIVAGMIWSALEIPQPAIMVKTVDNLAQVATPMGLIAMGASFDYKQVGAGMKPAMAASALKLMGFCALFLPVAVAMGFRQEHLVAILVMLGSATTVTCYVMARNMGHEGVLTSSAVAITTAASAFTLTFWLYIVKTLGLI